MMMNDLKKRLIPALMAATVALILIQWDWGYGLIVIAASIGLSYEMWKICNIIQPKYKSGHTVIHSLMTVYIIYYVLFHVFPSIFTNTALSQVPSKGFVIYVLFIAIMLLSKFWIPRMIPIISLFYPYIGIMALLELSFLDGNYNAAPVVFLLLTVWTADAAAYLAGNALGGPKLAPTISPNKTVSGWIGALLGIAILAIVYSSMFMAWRPMHLLLWIPLIWISATMGDLFESVLKRSAGIKDSGVFLPGHGGFLDRLDSLIFAAPFAYYIFKMI
jgi:CDP-diglyceride synthetase